LNPTGQGIQSIVAVENKYTMTINEFLKAKRAELDSFEKFWNDGAKEFPPMECEKDVIVEGGGSPELFPNSMEKEEWETQLVSFNT